MITLDVMMPQMDGWAVLTEKLGRKVQLGQPHGVEPPALGRIDLLEGLPKSLRRACTGRVLKLVEHAEFHR